MAPASQEVIDMITRIFESDRFIVEIEDESGETDFITCKSVNDLLENINAVDDTNILLTEKETNRYLGFVYVSLFNEGEEQIIDYTYNQKIIEVVDPEEANASS